MSYKLDPVLISANGTTKVKAIIRDRDDANRIVDSEIVTLESSASRDKLIKRLVKRYGLKSDDVNRQLLEIIDKAERDAPAEDIGLKKRLADAIMSKQRFAQDASGALYVFSGGVYRQIAALKMIKSASLELLHEWHLTRHWAPELAGAVAEYIGITAPELWQVPPVDKINVLNGIIDLSSRSLLPHTHEYLSPIQIPITFDPLATCPGWDEFLAEVLPSDAQGFGYEMFADLLTPDRSDQRAVMLIGSGANGKSVLLNAMEAAIGPENVATLSLQRIESDRFAPARLVGKLANINRDLPASDLKGTATFKQIVGGDSLTGERKFHDSFDFRPFVRLIFSANHAPRSPDASEGFFRRWIVCPFPNIFEGEDAVSSAELHRRLTTPAELSGLLNRALRILPELRERGFTLAPSMISAAAEFRALADPVAFFLDANTIQGQDLHVSKGDLFDCYRAAATKAGWAAIPIISFGRTLKKLRPAIGEAQRIVRGKERTWCWTGIGLKQDAPPSGSDDAPDPLWWTK